MIMPDKMPKANAGVSHQTPGQLLKTAREQLDLTQKDIAAQLNLQINTIAALESDDDEKLPVSMYVRGYIRSYARIVKLDADTLIKLYENDALPPPEIVPDVKQHTQISSRDKPVIAVTYLVTFGLVLLLFAWLQSTYVVNQDNKVMDTTAPQDKRQGGYLDYSYTIVIHPDTPFLEKTVNGKNKLSSELPLYVDDPKASEELTETLELPGSLSTDTTIIESTNNNLTIDDNNISQDTDRVSFSIIKSSWIKVYDSTNKIIYMDIAKPGEQLHLSGSAPFSVILGNAPGVEVIFKGKQFNTEPYSDAGVARFKLGE